MNVLVDNVMNLFEEYLVVKLRESHLLSSTWQSVFILIEAEFHLVIISENFLQGFFLVNLVDSQEAGHATNNNLIDFVFLKEIWLVFEDYLDKILNTPGEFWV